MVRVQSHVKRTIIDVELEHVRWPAFVSSCGLISCGAEPAIKGSLVGGAGNSMVASQRELRAFDVGGVHFDRAQGRAERELAAVGNILDQERDVYLREPALLLDPGMLSSNACL